MKDKINMCMVANGHNFAINLGILITSILINSNKEDEFCFHIITDNMSDDDRNKLIQLKEIKKFDIQFYTPDINRIDKYKRWAKEFGIESYWGYSIYLKLEVIYMLTHLDKVIFLDIDQIILKSMSEIYYTDFDNHYIIAAEHESYIEHYREDSYKLFNVKSIEEYKKNKIKLKNKTIEFYKKFKIEHAAFCTGFMCMNLKSLRNEMTEEYVDNYVQMCIDNNVRLYEEYIFFYFIKKDKIKFIDFKYNVSRAIWLKDEYCNVYIAHYSWGKVFEPSCNFIPKEKNSLLLDGWKYLSMTPWFKEDPIYFINIFNQYDKILLEKKIDKVISLILWLIPIKKIRDKIRNFLADY